MLDKTKQSIFQKYKKDDIKWLFFSVFSQKWNLLLSNWVFYSDKTLEELINTLFHWLIEKHKNIWNIVIDIIKDYKEIQNLQEIQKVSTKEYWILLTTENKSGIILPDTKWVESIQQAIKITKEKNWLEWNAKIITFTTDRFAIN
jgi:hypothetical protein